MKLVQSRAVSNAGVVWAMTSCSGGFSGGKNLVAGGYIILRSRKHGCWGVDVQGGIQL